MGSIQRNWRTLGDRCKPDPIRPKLTSRNLGCPTGEMCHTMAAAATSACALSTQFLRLSDGRNVSHDGRGCDERVRVIYTMPGRFLPKPVACSNACAICRTLKSSLSRPTICTPTGSPSGVKPPGTEAAGLPVAEIYQQDFIQSM